MGHYLCTFCSLLHSQTYILYSSQKKCTVKGRSFYSILFYYMLKSKITPGRIVLMQYMYRNPVSSSISGLSQSFFPGIHSLIANCDPIYCTQNNWLLIGQYHNAPST